MASERRLKLSTGAEVPLDGDLLAIVEALYKEVSLGDALNTSFETMRTEILNVIDQMNPSEKRNYLAESLFLNSVTYENEMLSAYVRRLEAAANTPMRPKPAKQVASKKRKAKAR